MKKYIKKQTDTLSDHTKAFVDLNAFSNNLKLFKRQIAPNTQIMAVVKANAYGHGAIEVARTAIEQGASFLAVARFSEALALRQQGIKAPILLFGVINQAQAVYAAHNNIRISVSSLSFAQKLNYSLAKANIKAFVHIKIDTGMGRLGLLPDYSNDLKENPAMDSAMQQIMGIEELEYINIEGIYTHFACADEKDKTLANRQNRLFEKLVLQLKTKGLELKFVHAANSAAMIDMPHTHFNMVRPGIALYGMYPSFEINHNNVPLTPIMEIRSKIIHLKQLPKGSCISYGCTYKTNKSTLIGTIPIGYGDGYSRMLSSKGRMLVRGSSAPIVGRVCMDLTMIDVGDIEGVCLGDEVTIIGCQGKEKITVDEIAALTGTINYEVIASLTGRIPIVYSQVQEKK